MGYNSSFAISDQFMSTYRNDIVFPILKSEKLDLHLQSVKVLCREFKYLSLFSFARVCLR